MSTTRSPPSVMATYLIWLLMASIAGNLLLTQSAVEASPQGAPNAACMNMTPGHGFAPQTSTPPFSTILVNNSDDKSLIITIQSDEPGTTFKGYLIVALGYEHGIEDHFVGKFSNPSDGNIINCIMFDGDAMPATGATHKNNSEKSSVTVKWDPDGFKGVVRFKTTYVKQFDTYWVNQDAGTSGGRSSIYAVSSASWFVIALFTLISTGSTRST